MKGALAFDNFYSSPRPLQAIYPALQKMSSARVVAVAVQMMRPSSVLTSFSTALYRALSHAAFQHRRDSERLPISRASTSFP